MGEGDYGIIMVKLFKGEDWSSLCADGEPEFALCRKVTERGDLPIAHMRAVLDHLRRWQALGSDAGLGPGLSEMADSDAVAEWLAAQDRKESHGR
jgi:hypothetical protein